MVDTGKTCDSEDFVIAGHTDRSGSTSYNVDLSLRRARSVAELMSALGVSEGSLLIEAMGEESPRVPTEDGVRNPQNRRVEISVSE